MAVVLRMDAGVQLNSAVGSMSPGKALQLPTFGSEASASAGTGGQAVATTAAAAAKPVESSSSSTAPFALGEGLPTLPPNMVTKILKVVYADMVELLNYVEMEQRHPHLQILRAPVPDRERSQIYSAGYEPVNAKTNAKVKCAFILYSKNSGIG